MHVVTGGAGFIGSAFVWKLNEKSVQDIIIVDNLGTSEKWKNLVPLKYHDYIHRDRFLKMVRSDDLPWKVDSIVHMGACSSTTEKDADFLMENNYRYSKSVAEYCLNRDIRFINASSAATYGDGSMGFSDEADLEKLRPLNMYGYSKQLLDLWAGRNGVQDRFVGLKFFNVFGPNEYHKGDMKSVVCKAYHQIMETGTLKLFQSHRPDYEHGEQKRDFVYIKDCVDIMWWLLNHPEVNGLFNLGTGQARTWNDLAHAVFSAMGREENIEYIPMPESIREKYQYFTQAEMNKLKQTGCPAAGTSLNSAVHDYVTNYLAKDDPHLSPAE